MSDVEREDWRKYCEYLLFRNIGGQAAEACIRHAQHFAYGLKRVKLRDVDMGIFARYFGELGRCNNIVAWRYRQAVSAVEMLFEMLGKKGTHNLKPYANLQLYCLVRIMSRKQGSTHLDFSAFIAFPP
jgi:hypothetical protein